MFHTIVQLSEDHPPVKMKPASHLFVMTLLVQIAQQQQWFAQQMQQQMLQQQPSWDWAIYLLGPSFDLLLPSLDLLQYTLDLSNLNLDLLLPSAHCPAWTYKEFEVTVS